MTRLGVILAALLVMGLGPSTAAQAAEESRPNVLLILADDLGWGDVGFNGREDWETPNLDRLAARGTVFKRFYTAAVVCAPSRAALLTGKFTIHDGVSRNNDDLPSDEVTIAEALKARGYRTALFGKWHHGKPPEGRDSYVHPMDQGFDEFFGFTDAVHAWEKFPEKLWDGREMTPVSGYADDLFTDRAVEFLARGEDGPFFLYVPYTTSHFHIKAPPDEVARFRGKFPEIDPAHPINANYAAMVSRLDRNVGRILEALDQHGLTDDTLIVFTSDHGATFEVGNLGASNFHDSNGPFRGQKRTLWEGGIRVPALAAWPGRIRAGTTSDAPFSSIDLLPTFLAAAGGEPDPAWKVDGVNLLPLWTAAEGSSGHPPAAPDRTLFWEWRSEGSDQLAAMNGRFKLVNTRGGRPELFDVEADPAERRDVAAQYPEVQRRLHEELRAWLETERPSS